ncbi:hypothetical protein [Absidia glauca]|uniref:Plectin/eS10 N-terminal domain-containing protein n=1 Tax=Absidia glauca TaxID=4829 RepID=A0A163JIX3_ABSGL|nr:hypothetical protein [Absidia glauca]
MDAASLDTKISSPRRSPVPSKSTSAIGRRNVDRERELQRLKSLGVVSILNKTFRSQDNVFLSPAPMPSPSSSTSTSSSGLLGDRPPQQQQQPRLRPSSSSSDLLQRSSTKETFLSTTMDRHVHKSSSGRNWVMAILPAEQDQPRPPPSDENGNSTASEPILDDSNDDENPTSDRPQQQQLLLQQQLDETRKEQIEMERSTQHTLEEWLKQKELESVKVQQLSNLIVKQDLVIHQLESSLSMALSENQLLQQNTTDDASTQQELVALRQELATLQAHKTGYEQMIVSLCSELESSQDQTRKLTLLADTLNQQCQSQQQQIDEKLGRMVQQLAEKDAVIRKYRETTQSDKPPSSSSQQQQQQQRYSQLINDTATIHSVLSTGSSSRISMAFSDVDGDLARYSSSSSSFSRLSSARTNPRHSLPRRRGKASVLSWPGGCIPPPSGPPPSSPLPPLPIIDDDQVDPELKHMTMQPYSSDDDDDHKALTTSLEQLLLQAPSGYTLDDETSMNEAYREFTEQLQTRLSISKEIDRLELWDHERLRQHHQQKQRRVSLAPTQVSSTSSNLDGDDTPLFIMLIQKENRKAIYETLFKDGALVAAKDFNLAKHPEIDVPNLEVIKSMQSLTSKGFVKTQFSWQFYYYTLTDEGIDYLRECKSPSLQWLLWQWIDTFDVCL